MGRGRAKAKQTKVARALKYHSPSTDLRELERELSGATGPGHGDAGEASGSDQDDEEEAYDEYPGPHD